MKYMVINQSRRCGDQEVTEFNTEKEAVNYAEMVFYPLRKNGYDVENTDYLAAVKTVNPDENSPDHYDFDPIEEYIVDGEVVFSKKNWSELCEYFRKHTVQELTNAELVYVAERVPNANHADDYFLSFEMENRTGLLYENYSGYYAWEDFVQDCCKILQK